MPPPPQSDHWHLEHLLCVRADLQRAADYLPEPTRTIVVLHYRDDWSYDEIATGRGPAGEHRQHGFGGMVDREGVGTLARLGARRLCEHLTRAGG